MPLYRISMLTTRLAMLLLATFLLAACDKAKVMEENQHIQDFKWDYQDKKTFEANITDTLAHYNIYVNLRHSFQFEWRNVYINIKTELPDGQKFDKRVNLLLSEPDGHWYGDCLGDNCDFQIPIQDNARLPMPGKYKFTITQDMRINPLQLIKSVGMRVEKVDAPKQ